jgi:hypothetical protein
MIHVSSDTSKTTSYLQLIYKSIFFFKSKPCLSLHKKHKETKVNCKVNEWKNNYFLIKKLKKKDIYTIHVQNKIIHKNWPCWKKDKILSIFAKIVENRILNLWKIRYWIWNYLISF